MGFQNGLPNDMVTQTRQAHSQLTSGLANDMVTQTRQAHIQLTSGLTIGDGLTGDGPLSDADIFDAFFESLGQQPNVPNGHQTSAMFGNNPTGQMSATEAHILQLVEESGFELDEGATFIDPD